MSIEEIVSAAFEKGDSAEIVQAVRLALLRAFTEGFDKGHKTKPSTYPLAVLVTDAWLTSRTRQTHGDTESEANDGEGHE